MMDNMKIGLVVAVSTFVLLLELGFVAGMIAEQELGVNATSKQFAKPIDTIYYKIVD